MKDFVLKHWPNAVAVECADMLGRRTGWRIRVCWSPRHYLCKPCKTEARAWRAAEQKIRSRFNNEDPS